MNNTPGAPRNIDEYIARFPKEVQDILQKIRTTIKKSVPAAEEAIRYQMPSFHLKGQYLVYFAAYKKHIGLYPLPSGDSQLNEEISAYRAGKGTLQFPFDRQIPYKLIANIVKRRAEENLQRAGTKEKRKQR